MEDSSLIDRLERLGLSEKEIDTYLSILEHGEAKASTIADDAGVSKRYVYSVSEKLEDRGFVEVNDHAVPTLIRANPPEEVVERLSSELLSLGPDLASRWNRVSDDRREFEIIKAQPTVVKRIREFLQSAEDEVTLSIPAKLLPQIADELRETVDRNVLVFVLLTGDESTELDVFGDHPPASVVRVWTERAPVLFTVDNSLGLFAPYELLARSNTGQQAVAIAQEQLVPILVGSFFGNYWPIADEAHVADAEPLPSDYQSFRHAVFAATRYQNQDVPSQQPSKPDSSRTTATTANSPAASSTSANPSSTRRTVASPSRTRSSSRPPTTTASPSAAPARSSRTTKHEASRSTTPTDRTRRRRRGRRPT